MHRLDLDQAGAWARGVDGITAAWVEGSIARGEADQYSDLDLHLAVAETHWAELLKRRRSVVEELGDLVALEEAGNDRSWIMPAVLAPSRWVDFTFEREPRVLEGVRTEPPLVLFDDSGCTAQVTVDEKRVQNLLNDHVESLASGAEWLFEQATRISGRGDPLGIVEYAHRVVWMVTAPALLLADRVLPRPYGDHARRMSNEARSAVERAVRSAEAGDLDAVLRSARAALGAARSTN